MKHLPEGRHISIENLPLNVEMLLRNSSKFDELVQQAIEAELTYENYYTLLDLLSWLKTELT